MKKISATTLFQTEDMRSDMEFQPYRPIVALAYGPSNMVCSYLPTICISRLTCSSSIQCDHSEIEGKVRMVLNCFQGDDSIAIHFSHKVVGLAEPYWNMG